MASKFPHHQYQELKQKFNESSENEMKYLFCTRLRCIIDEFVQRSLQQINLSIGHIRFYHIILISFVLCGVRDRIKE
jgi:hypothetical protein